MVEWTDNYLQEHLQVTTFSASTIHCVYLFFTFRMAPRHFFPGMSSLQGMRLNTVKRASKRMSESLESMPSFAARQMTTDFPDLISFGIVCQE